MLTVNQKCTLILSCKKTRHKKRPLQLEGCFFLRHSWTFKICLYETGLLKKRQKKDFVSEHGRRLSWHLEVWVLIETNGSFALNVTLTAAHVAVSSSLTVMSQKQKESQRLGDTNPHTSCPIFIWGQYESGQPVWDPHLSLYMLLQIQNHGRKKANLSSFLNRSQWSSLSLFIFPVSRGSGRCCAHSNVPLDCKRRSRAGTQLSR